jgi:hypothetical protein
VEIARGDGYKGEMIEMSYGSFHNLLAGNSKSLTEIEIGMGATQIGWSDRLAYTVVGIETYKTGKKAGQVKAVIATRDIAKRVDSNGYYSESQDYEFTTNPNAKQERYTLRKDGRYMREGATNSGVLLVGVRMEYFDPHF